MLIRNPGQFLVFAAALMAFCTAANAEKTVYKWVDEDGVVHFGDAPPPGANTDEAETLVIPKSPPVAAPAEPAATAPAASTDNKKQTEQPKKDEPSLYVKTDLSQLSLAELDLRCEEAREKMIAPLREAAVAECKQDKREDPAFCERFNADFGDGGRTASGYVRPRMFDDLAECQEALQERNRRPR